MVDHVSNRARATNHQIIKKVHKLEASWTFHSTKEVVVRRKVQDLWDAACADEKRIGATIHSDDASDEVTQTTSVPTNCHKFSAATCTACTPGNHYICHISIAVWTREPTNTRTCYQGHHPFWPIL